MKITFTPHEKYIEGVEHKEVARDELFRPLTTVLDRVSMNSTNADDIRIIVGSTIYFTRSVIVVA